MKSIPLTRGKVAIVDDVDSEWALQFKWRATRPTPTGIERWYAIRGYGKQTFYMHREIMMRMGADPDNLADHKDNDGLNNQRKNLRPCSPAQNCQNMRKRTGSSSRFKGVYWHRPTRKWMARLHHDWKSHFLGRFKDEEAAAKAYDAAAREHYGEFAKLNFA